MTDFNKNWIKSVQFRENRDHILLELAKFKENTQNYHAKGLKNRLIIEKSREGNCVIQRSIPPYVTIAKKKFVFIKF